MFATRIRFLFTQITRYGYFLNLLGVDIDPDVKLWFVLSV